MTQLTTMALEMAEINQDFQVSSHKRGKCYCYHAPCSLTFKLNTLTMYELSLNLILTNIGPQKRQVLSMWPSCFYFGHCLSSNLLWGQRGSVKSSSEWTTCSSLHGNNKASIQSQDLDSASPIRPT